jgi:hypothetical protein
MLDTIVTLNACTIIISVTPRFAVSVFVCKISGNHIPRKWIPSNTPWANGPDCECSYGLKQHDASGHTDADDATSTAVSPCFFGSSWGLLAVSGFLYASVLLSMIPIMTITWQSIMAITCAYSKPRARALYDDGCWARGEGRERGNVLVTISKPPVALKAGGITDVAVACLAGLEIRCRFTVVVQLDAGLPSLCTA